MVTLRGSKRRYARRLLSGALIVILPRNETKIGCITGWQNPLLSAVKVAAVTGQNATRDVALLMVFSGRAWLGNTNSRCPDTSRIFSRTEMV